MALKFDIKGYRKWIDSTDFFFHRFCELKQLLVRFINEGVVNQRVDIHKIGSELWTAYNKCDEIDYNDDEIAYAYSAVHFLDRYYRFTRTFLKLIDYKYLPISYREVTILDVGTGPGPALYAVSDVYTSLREFGKISGDSRLINLKFSTDYVERSPGFRNWLHHFTEFINVSAPSGIQWVVPYHHGTYGDFQHIEFNIRRTHWEGSSVEKKRFNMVLFSNFLTQHEQIDLWRDEIRNCFRFLRNKGKLLVVGGKGNNKYKLIYEKLDDTLLKYDFSNANNIAKCTKKTLKQNAFVFDLAEGKYGAELKNYFREIYTIFEINDAVKNFSPEVYAHFQRYIGDGTGTPKKWSVQVYEKYGRLKWYKFRTKQMPNPQIQVSAKKK